MSGTGKSLSIICSALQWLLDRNEKINNNSGSSDKVVVDGEEEDESEPDWIRNFTVNSHDDAKTNRKSPFRVKKRDSDARKGEEEVSGEVNEQEFCLEEYESEEDYSSSSSSKRKPVGGGLGFYTSSEDEEDGKECEEEGGLKVFYCSRTHSQLSQFVKELRKTVFAQKVRVVCLGSRKNMCINEGLPTIIIILSFFFFFFIPILFF